MFFGFRFFGFWCRSQPSRRAAGVAAGIFDGVDLDWEWPGSEGNAGNVIRPEDKHNFTLLAAAAQGGRDQRPPERCHGVRSHSLNSTV